MFSLWLARTTSPSNPASPVTWYQRERHSSAAEAIPCSLSLSVVCASRLFDSSLPTLPPLCHFCPVSSSYLFLSSLHIPSLQPLSSTPLPSILPLQTWPYLGLWERGLVRVVGWGGGPRLSPWRSTSKQSDEGGVGVRSHVSSHIVTVRAGGESDGNTEGWVTTRSEATTANDNDITRSMTRRCTFISFIWHSHCSKISRKLCLGKE